MSFEVSELNYSPLLSEKANEFLAERYSKVVVDEKHLSQLPDIFKTLEFAPYLLPKVLSNNLEAIVNFEVRSDDIFVCGVIKTGTSWLQNIVWLLTHDLDYEKNKSVDRKQLICNFGDFTLTDSAPPLGLKIESYGKEFFGNIESPRIFKFNDPVQFLPTDVWSKQTKIIFITRNPKDTVASEYHYWRNAVQIDISIDDIINGEMNDSWACSPRSNHILNYWKIRHLPNVFFVAYEDLVDDPFATIKEISQFLNCDYTDEQLKQLAEYSSFSNMRNIKTVNRESDVEWVENNNGKKRPDPEYRFLRKGKVGTFRDDLNEEQIKRLDEWTEKWTQNTDFKFKM